MDASQITSLSMPAIRPGLGRPGGPLVIADPAKQDDDWNNSARREQKRNDLSSQDFLSRQKQLRTREEQSLENSDGDSFSKIIDLNMTQDKIQRTVTQSAETGNIIQAEQVFDRQQDGSFRETRRFTDSLGETQTDIRYGVTPDKAAIAAGIYQPLIQPGYGPPVMPRGIQYDRAA